MNKLTLLLSLAVASSLAACASEYERVAIPPAEQQHKTLPPAPDLHHINWKVLHYQGHQYYALDDKNMNTLTDNLSKMADYNDAATSDYKNYETTHPEKETKVIRKKGFWVYANKWWFGCNDKEFQNTPSCKPFNAPDDYVPPVKDHKDVTPTPATTPAPPAAVSSPSKEN